MPQISASVDAKIIVMVNELAKKERRSFSEMVNILLTKATENVRVKNNKKP